MKIFDIKSPEGIPLSDYNFVYLFISLPIAFFSFIFYKVLTFRVKENIVENCDSRINNAIIYGFHKETFISSLECWNKVGIISNSNEVGLFKCHHNVGAWLGSHTILSYVGTFHCVIKGFKCFRYNRKKRTRPLQQISSFLNKYNGFIYILTDSGGPYGKVRHSLVTLSLETNRPLVPVRFHTPRTFKIYGHKFPLFPKIQKMILGDPISSSDLRKLKNDEQQKLIQERIDGLI